MSHRAFTALVNPIAGGGGATQRLAPVVTALRDRGHDVAVQATRSIGEAAPAARRVCDSGRVVLAAGGDGFARAVAEGVVAEGGVLGIVPAGRGNDFARKAAVPSDPVALADLLADGGERAVDVIDIDGTIALGNVSAGLDSVATAMINARRFLPPAFVYRYAGIRTGLTWRPRRYALELDGRALDVTGNMVVIANSGAYGHGHDIVPAAEIDDGLLDVLVVGALSLPRMVAFEHRLQTGRHIAMDGVEVHRAAVVRLECADAALPMAADGDQLGGVPFTARVRPGALRLLAPAVAAAPHAALAA